jgi:hypothetical protein
MQNQPTILEIRPMSESELDAEGWEGTRPWRIPFVIEVSDGSIYYPASDTEGNEPGTWFILGAGENELDIHDKTVRSSLVGQPIMMINRASRGEMALCGWLGEDPTTVIRLGEDGHPVLIPSQDDEGNGPGTIFGIAEDGDAIILG